MRAAARLDELWRRSAGRLVEASPERRWSAVRAQLKDLTGWSGFLAAELSLEADQMVSSATRAELDALPASVHLHGDRVALSYELENGSGVVRMQLREGQARRLRSRDLPVLDRPLRFEIARGGTRIRAASLEELARTVTGLDRGRKVRRRRR